jgi:phage minor structural protein
MENVTPLDILDGIRELYPGLTYRFYCISKTIAITAASSGSDTGVLVSLDTNLRATYYKGKSTSLITRLYAEGKDGLTFASINDGKPYVDSTAYKDGAIICGYWKATEYTDASDLLAATQARLATLSVPERSFDIDIAVSDIDQFPLFGVVRLSDDTIPRPIYQGVTIRVAERWIHPDHPQKNKVILSTAPARIQTQVKALMKAIGG